MRHFYMDEAGIGKIGKEPFTIVAGFLLHVDNQYLKVQKHLLDLADELFSSHLPDGFHFHATDLWHGAGFFPRKNWELSKRLEILGRLADIPAQFDLPIIYSCVDRAKFLLKPIEDMSSSEIANHNSRCHTTCFMNCLNQVDQWVFFKLRGEQVFVIVEMHDQHQRALNTAASIMTDPRPYELLRKDGEIPFAEWGRIVETPLFASKSGNSPLQIADVCAFILSRALAGSNHVDELLKKIEPQLIAGFRDDFFRDSRDDETS